MAQEKKENCGIYKITCKANGKFYIGSAVNFNRRKREHLNCLRNNFHINHFLQSAWNKYGEEAFVFELIEILKEEELILKEQQYLDLYYDEQQICYNMCPTAGSKLGTKLSEETKEKISKSNKGKKVSEEARKRMSDAQKKNIKGHFMPGENNPMFRVPKENHPFYGKKHKPESIEKMKKSHEGFTNDKLGKRVAQVDLETGKIIAIYKSYSEAQRQTGIKGIERCVNKRSKSAGGYWWKHLEFDEENTQYDYTEQVEKAKTRKTGVEEHTDDTKRKISLTKMPKNMKIFELDKEGNVLKIFDCSYDVCREYSNIDYKLLSRVLCGERKSVKGKCFEYRLIDVAANLL